MDERSQNKLSANPLLKTMNRNWFAGGRGWWRALGIVGIGWAFFFLLLWLLPLPAEKGWSTIVTDEQGTVIHAYLSADDKWRMKTELDEISPLLQQAIIEKEDKWFYHHPGVNPLAMARAFFRNVFTGRRTSGASTITMQVARSLQPGRRSYSRKILEVFRAFQLELRYSKKEILQMYLNHVPYGGNIEGVKSAAVLYFQKNPWHLSLAEVMALSVIPNRPNSLVMGRDNERIVGERNRWLQYFREQRIFAEADIKDAMDEPLAAFRHAAPQELPHLSYQLKKSGQPIIHTWISRNTQFKVEKLLGDYVRGLQFQHIHQAAAIVIDNRTNRVISYVGSADFKDSVDGGQVNGAAGIRQPGSTLKPLLYGMCIDKGLLTAKAVITDAAVNYAGYAPENYDKKFNGYVTMEYALSHSLNIPAVKSLRLLGKDAFIQELSSLHFRQVQKDQKKLGLSMILGGCGTTLEELTALFAGFAQEGRYQWPAYTQADSALPSRRMISTGASFMLNDILSKVNRPDFPLNWAATEKMPRIAWKTGTSYGRRDAWSIGYNKHYTIGVWTGNFSGVGVESLSGAEVATPLLFRLFNTIDYDNEKEWFQQPADVAVRAVCPVTGLLPGEHCAETVSDYFIPLVSGTQVCHHLEEIAVSADESISYCNSCRPTTGYKKLLYQLYDADMQAWMTERHMLYRKVPPHNPACETIFKDAAPQIKSPQADAEYLIEKKNPEPLQLVCQAGSDVSKVYWYINNKFYKAAELGQKVFFTPQEGPVKISCTDDKGRNKDVWIRVKYMD